MSDPRIVSERPLVLQIEKAIYGGAGLARHDGKAIFIPYTLPDETVSAIVTHSKASFAEAALKEIIEPSAARVEPPCPYFGHCGGCHYQHAGYPAQLAIKEAVLLETLTRAHLAPLPAVVIHSGAPLSYRNRIRLHLNPVAMKAGDVLGYRARGTHELIAIDQCPIALPRLEEAIRPLATLLIEQACAPYFGQVELSLNHDGSELLLALWLRERSNPDEANAHLAQLCPALARSLPRLRGACVHGAAQAAGALAGAPPRLPKHGARQKRQSEGVDRRPEEPGAESASRLPVATWGAQSMTYRIGAFDYRVSLGSFFQVNHSLLEVLVRLATGGRSGALAWDLYAGVGLFSRVLAGSFGQVIAVEGAPGSSADLRVNLAAPDLAAPHRAICSSTLDFLRREASPPGGSKARRERPNFVLVDPPRSGLGEEVTRLLAQIGPADITYVSCDPATLSRDLRGLVDSGYKLQQLHLIDLFPQTFHLETVALLSRP
jgi:23S rRNA (uracil1939-C5)-methyltransferase